MPIISASNEYDLSFQVFLFDFIFYFHRFEIVRNHGKFSKSLLRFFSINSHRITDSSHEQNIPPLLNMWQFLNDLLDWIIFSVASTFDVIVEISFSSKSFRKWIKMLTMRT